jgi:hypothetical protein
MDFVPAAPSAATPAQNADEEYCVEYSFYPTTDQKALLKRWFGHIRSIHNAAFNYFKESPEVNTAIGKLVRYVALSKFLMELPASTLGDKIALVAEECEEFTIEHHTSRKQDIQVLGFHGEDFELTGRATVVVTQLGELDIEFDEGPPAPDPVCIELIHDPLAEHADTIRLYYKKGAANNG